MGKPAPTTSEVILAAAQRTIRGHGSEQFTLSAVAAEAGVSRPTLYRWFPTKSLLLGAVAAYEVEQFDIGLQALADEHHDPARRLDAALRYLVNYLEETVGSDSIQVDPAFALQGLADSLPPHIESVARVLGDALDEVPSVRDGTLTREQAAEIFLRLAYSHYLVPHRDAEELLSTMRAFAGLPKLRRSRATVVKGRVLTSASRGRRRVLVGAALTGAAVAVWRSGLLARVRQVVLPAVADHAWQLPGLAGLMERGYNRRIELFASYDVQPGDVVMLGDSITEGADWPALLPGIRIHNHGIGGDDTDGVLRRLALVTDRRPGKVFVMIGTNDIGKGVHSVDEIVRNIATIVDRIRADSPTTEIYLQSVLPRVRRRADQVGGVNRGIETLARDRGATWIDLRPIFEQGDGAMDLSLAPDALHPNAEGNRRWAEFLAPHVS